MLSEELKEELARLIAAHGLDAVLIEIARTGGRQDVAVLHENGVPFKVVKFRDEEVRGGTGGTDRRDTEFSELMAAYRQGQLDPAGQDRLTAVLDRRDAERRARARRAGGAQ